MMRRQLRLSVLCAAICATATVSAAQGRNVPVPSSCTPQVNQKLDQMIQDQSRGYVENVMVCGIAVKTTVNSGGRHGSHHIVTLSVQLPDNRNVQVQVAINDSLDGPVSAAAGQKVFAYGQGYIDHGPWAAGIHDVHCSTHPSADNGWVVVDGTKTPSSCPAP
jgi:hypothetical protein